MQSGQAAAKEGDWEGAADAYADALFDHPESADARQSLRVAAEQAMARRTARIQYERMRVLYELGLVKEPPVPPAEPFRKALQPPAQVRIGPPTLAVVPPPRRPRRRYAQAKAVEAPEPEAHEPTAADREMARFLYFQGLKAYAENELEAARQAWRKALQLDPQMERAQKALERIAAHEKKP